MDKMDFAPIAAAVRAALEAQGFLKLVGAEVVEIAPGAVVMALDRRPEVLQQGGLFHGGVIAFLIDNATTAAAGTVIDRSRHTVLTAEYKLNILAPARGDRLICPGLETRSHADRGRSQGALLHGWCGKIDSRRTGHDRQSRTFQGGVTHARTEHPRTDHRRTPR